MQSITDHYISVTRQVKLALQQRVVIGRTNEESRVYENFRRKAKEQYKVFK